jgi:hypothetical protein
VVGFVQVALREPRADVAKQIRRDQGIRCAWVNAIAVLRSNARAMGLYRAQGLEETAALLDKRSR